MKQCSRCRKVKLNSQFNFDKRSSNGLTSACKDCINKTNREWRRKNKDKVLDAKKRYREKYKDRPMSDSQKEYFKRHHKKYKEQFPEKVRASKMSQYVECPKGFHRHHWSYNEQDMRDVIIITSGEHRYIHRYIEYDQPSRYYKDNCGTILCSKKQHLKHINKLISLFREEVNHE